ncbi:MAG: hypothetical protein IJQ60_06965 [Prevotella sp.]|jgi:hypothetical protein|nr:hypothetical protein [Prevotella sp.]
MQININTNHFDWQFEIANRYLPVRLSTTTFDGYGECIVIVANRADGMTTDITENNKSEVFITLMDRHLYEDIKARVLEMDYWIPQNHYNTCDGLADGKPRKIHLDGMVF